MRWRPTIRSRADEKADQQRQRAAHHERDGREQDDGHPRTRGVRRGRQDVPAVRVAGVRRQQRHHLAQVGQSGRDRQPDSRDPDFEPREDAEERFRPDSVPSIRPRADEIAAGAKAEHEHGHHERRGVDRVAEDVAEHRGPRRPDKPGRSVRSRRNTGTAACSCLRGDESLGVHHLEPASNRSENQVWIISITAVFRTGVARRKHPRLVPPPAALTSGGETLSDSRRCPDRARGDAGGRI